jgi:NAD(P)-dependent dehydrogenase (short-subunit alcohol dehydrogenase family)
LSNACLPPSLNNTTSDHLPNEQTNYLSHFYLTCLLLPTLLSSALSSPANTIRIVNISSDGHAKLAPKEGIDFTSPAFPNFETSSTWTRYGISKLAQVLHSKEIARCYGEQGIISVSLHPGTVKTNLSNGPRGTTPWYKFIQPLVELGAPGPEKGAYNALWCAASPELKMEDNGGYFEPVGKKTGASACGKDGKMARKLWDWTERKLREVGFWIEE